MSSVSEHKTDPPAVECFLERGAVAENQYFRHFRTVWPRGFLRVEAFALVYPGALGSFIEGTFVIVVFSNDFGLIHAC
jgi:hypothetical protein